MVAINWTNWILVTDNYPLIATRPTAAPAKAASFNPATATIHSLPDQPEILNEMQVAELFNMSVSAVRRWRLLDNRAGDHHRLLELDAITGQLPAQAPDRLLKCASVEFVTRQGMRRDAVQNKRCRPVRPWGGA